MIHIKLIYTILIFGVASYLIVVLIDRSKTLGDLKFGLMMLDHIISMVAGLVYYKHFQKQKASFIITLLLTFSIFFISVSLTLSTLYQDFIGLQTTVYYLAIGVSFSLGITVINSILSGMYTTISSKK